MLTLVTVIVVIVALVWAFFKYVCSPSLVSPIILVEFFFFDLLETHQTPLLGHSLGYCGISLE